jgi:hypothetical protein
MSLGTRIKAMETRQRQAAHPPMEFLYLCNEDILLMSEAGRATLSTQVQAALDSGTPRLVCFVDSDGATGEVNHPLTLIGIDPA